MAFASPNPDLARDLATLIEEAVAGGVAPGIAVGVYGLDGTRIELASGYARLDPPRPMRKTSLFQVMSMTKPVVAVAAVRLAQQGKLDLDAPLSSYLPDFPARARPTLRDLLTHTSGLSRENPAGMSDRDKQRCSLAEMAKLLAREPLEFEPGSRCKYSGGGFIALGRVIEVVTGQPLALAVEQLVLRPARMSSTWFFLPEGREVRVAQAYWRDGEAWAPADHDPSRPGAVYANPAGGLYSSLRDMGKLGLALLRPGLLDEAWLRELLRPQVADDSPASWGLGVLIYSGPGDMAGCFGHEGAYGTAFWADPQSDTAMVLMTQRPGLESTLRERIQALVRTHRPPSMSYSPVEP